MWKISNEIGLKWNVYTQVQVCAFCIEGRRCRKGKEQGFDSNAYFHEIPLLTTNYQSHNRILGKMNLSQTPGKEYCKVLTRQWSTFYTLPSDPKTVFLDEISRKFLFLKLKRKCIFWCPC